MRAVVTSVALSTVLLAQTVQPPTGSANASAPTVLVAVTAKGEPVLDLQPAHLTVLVDERPARVEYMQAVGGALAVVLMFDVSSSMSAKFNELTIRDFGPKVVPTLRTNDRVRFAEIGGGVAVGAVAPHTNVYFSSPPALIARPEPSDRVARTLMTSPIWDGIAAGVEAIRADERHRLIVLVTDGFVTGSRIGLEDAIGLAAAAQTVVSVVDLHTAKAMVVPQDNQKERSGFRPDGTLRRIAAATAGGYFPDALARGERDYHSNRFAPEIPGLVAKAISESRGAYRIRLQVPADGAPHTLKITSTRPGVVIRTPMEIRQ